MNPKVNADDIRKLQANYNIIDEIRECHTKETEEERTFVLSSTRSIYNFCREVGHNINVSTPCSINVHTEFIN